MAPHSSLVSLVYSSTATRPFDDDELAGLLAVSRARNAERNITGMLLYREREFIQILEGTRADVDSLMADIAGDRRHSDVRVLLEEPLHERRFEKWTMGYRPLVAAQPEMLDGYRDSFDDLRIGDHDMIGRALMELTMWFRVREAAPGRSSVRTP